MSECKIKRHLHEIQTVYNTVQSTGYTEVQEDQIRLGLNSSAKGAKAKTAKATQEKIGQKKKVSHLMSNQHRGFLVTRELKMEIYRQAAAKESCSKGLLEHLSEGNTTSVDVHEFDLYFLNSLCKTVR